MKEQFFIYEWMFYKLGLKGNELLIFAYLFDDIKRQGQCVATLQQISDGIGVSVDTARTLTNNLANYNIISKRKYYNGDNRLVGCIYEPTVDFIEFLYKQGLCKEEECNNE